MLINFPHFIVAVFIFFTTSTLLAPAPARWTWGWTVPAIWVSFFLLKKDVSVWEAHIQTFPVLPVLYVGLSLSSMGVEVGGTTAVITLAVAVWLHVSGMWLGEWPVSLTISKRDEISLKAWLQAVVHLKVNVLFLSINYLIGALFAQGCIQK